MLLQASMNTFKTWFAEVVEIRKTFSYEPAIRRITESRGKTLGRRKIQPCLNFSSTEKWQPISTM